MSRAWENHYKVAAQIQISEGLLRLLQEDKRRVEGALSAEDRAALRAENERRYELARVLSDLACEWGVEDELHENCGEW